MNDQTKQVSGSNATGSASKSASTATSTLKLGRGLGRLIPVKGHTNASDGAPEIGLGSAQATSSQPAVKSDSGFEPKITKSPAQSPTSVADQNIQAVLQIDVTKIKANPRQPRTEFSDQELSNLADSIRNNGLLQPIVVRRLDGEPGFYELISGERRWRAVQKVGLTTISAIVAKASDENSGVWSLIENIHRTDLNPMDRALAIQRLSHEFSLTHDQLAKKISLDRSTVTNLLRLADLDLNTAQLVRNGLLSQGHAKALLGVVDLKTRATLAASTIRGEWSVRDLEREVQRITSDSKSIVPRGTLPTRKAVNIKDLETRLSQVLGTRVVIHLGRKPNTGKISLEFFSLDQFEGVLSKLGLRQDQIRLDQ